MWKIQKIMNVQEVIRAYSLEIFKKLIICAARLSDTLEYLYRRGGASYCLA